jgi:hypothetical protein
MVENSPAHNLQELFDSIEIEDGQQRLGEMQLRLQKLGAVLITLDM